MAKEKTAQVGSGATGGQGDVDVDPTKSSAQSEPKGAEGGGEGGQDQQYITPTALQGIMDAHKRTTSNEIKQVREQNAALAKGIEDLKNAILEQSKAAPGKGKEELPENAEVVELRRTVDELKRKAEAESARAADERQKRLDTDFRNAVTNALVAAGCEKPEAGYAVIRELVKHDPETGRIFATVKTQWGEEDLDLKTYIERHFREEVLPHIFKGKMRPGGPAGGDDASGGGQGYQFTREQVFDAVAYAADPEKHRAAIEKGRVKGLPKPGAATA